MLLQACLPLAFRLIPEAAMPNNTYIHLLIDLDVDLFPNDNEGVQAICDDWGVTQEALMVSFLFSSISPRSFIASITCCHGKNHCPSFFALHSNVPDWIVATASAG